MNLRDFTSVKERRHALERELGVTLPNIGSFSLDERLTSSRNCENMIGVTQVPMGIAGPLRIKGKGSKGQGKEYFVPLATTEGALVASVNRGCKAVSESGGAIAVAEQVGTTRGPVFKVKDIGEIEKLKKWLADNFMSLQHEASKTSTHLTLTRFETTAASPYCFIRFYFDTGDAMGMNMASIATQKIVERIEKETGIICLTIAGNFDIDKKPAWLNAIGLRGWSVRTEAVISKETVLKILKTTPEKIYSVWLAKCMIGSALSGSIGFNAHFANVVAAIFIATGQDVAHTVEGSLGITTVEVRGKDLYVSIHLPALLIGTVGGGTTLSTQQEALSIMGVAGTGHAHEFAEIVGAAVLAGELSLLASLAEGSLARAHQKLGRGENL